MLPTVNYWYLLSLTVWDFFQTEFKSRDINFAVYRGIYIFTFTSDLFLQFVFMTVLLLFTWQIHFSIYCILKNSFELSKAKVRANPAFSISKVQEFVNQNVFPNMHAEHLYSNKFSHDIISKLLPLSWA